MLSMNLSVGDKPISIKGKIRMFKHYFFFNVVMRTSNMSVIKSVCWFLGAKQPLWITLFDRKSACVYVLVLDMTVSSPIAPQSTCLKILDNAMPRSL